MARTVAAMRRVLRRRTAPADRDGGVFKELRLVGGHPALDLVNTLKYRGRDDPCDVLTSYSDLIAWSQIAGLITAAEATSLRAAASADPAEADAASSRVREFREQFRMLIDPKSRETPVFGAAVTAVERAIAALRPTVRYVAAEGTVEFDVPVRAPGDLVSRIVDAASDLLVARPGLRIRECEGSDCDWLFIDRTKARSRRWCDTRICGNRMRVRRFRS
jgi:predicted RNA-binding Zn ribbon-like protein